MISLARALMIIGVVIFILGGMLFLAAKVNLPLGRLPGDFRIERQNLTCIVPLATSILVSIVLTLVLNLVLRILGKK